MAFCAVYRFYITIASGQNLTASAAIPALSIVAAPYFTIAIAIAATRLPVQNTAIVYGISFVIVSTGFVVEFEFSPEPVSIVTCIAGSFVLTVAVAAFSGFFTHGALLHTLITMTDTAFTGAIAIPAFFVTCVGSGSFASTCTFSGSLTVIALFFASSITVSAGSIRASFADDFPGITVVFQLFVKV